MIVEAQVTFNHVSGLDEDRVVNTWHFEAPGGPVLDAGTAELVRLCVAEFYNNPAAPSVNSVSSFLSNVIVRAGGATVRLYNAEAAPPRLPLYTLTMGVSPALGAGDEPSEVASCLSYAGAPVAGSNFGPGPHLPARNRGRIYLGPLLAAVKAGSPPRIDVATNPNSFGFSVLNAAIRLRDNPLGAPVTWGVWSPTGDAFREVTRVWIDNAFDIQRRRGEDATVRLTDGT